MAGYSTSDSLFHGTYQVIIGEHINLSCKELCCCDLITIFLKYILMARHVATVF